ncbi:chromate efflux transporter [Thioclava sp. SK-1]|uniref:chromate efflux transporter n=1 Tax=Thioclava sp. SK-1 TaxID=1889770 RepID=UPI00210186EB|nr:chromate efflux transporter [Thioclava sp. SK-1]
MRIGLASFGGPAAQIALLHRSLVSEERWLSEQEFLRALSFCMVLPGPEAMQLAAYTGWRLRGVWGGVIAGLWFVGPGAAVILGLALIYTEFEEIPIVHGMLIGMQACVIAIVCQALIRLSQRALTDRQTRGIAVSSFVGLYVFGVPFPVIIAAAMIFGALRMNPTPNQDMSRAHRQIGLRRLWRNAFPWALAWLLPLVALLATSSLYGQLAGLFSQLSALSFGGAYALLAWMSQAMVEMHGWLTPKQMIDALGLAETTPGPLVLVTAFTGFLVGHDAGGVWGGLLGWLIAIWMTFVPCFLWVFTGAPVLENLTTHPRINAALRAVTAAIVGVIANLSVWFALHVLFAGVTPGPFALQVPQINTLSLPVAAVVLASIYALIQRKLPFWVVLCAAAVCGGGMAICNLIE